MTNRSHAIVNMVGNTVVDDLFLRVQRDGGAHNLSTIRRAAASWQAVFLLCYRHDFYRDCGKAQAIY